MTTDSDGVMLITCMTADSDSCLEEFSFSRNVLYHFSLSKVIPQKPKFNIE